MSGLKASMLGAVATCERKDRAFHQKRVCITLHYNARLLREGIPCSRCARLGAKGLHACQGLQECKSFVPVLAGGDSHPESTVCSLLSALAMWPERPTQTAWRVLLQNLPTWSAVGRGFWLPF